MVSVELGPEIEHLLEDLSTRTGRSTTDHVREAVLSYLEDLEDVTLAEERLRNPGKRWTLEEAEREFGLES
ncbi:MAG TPA: ribbon-helix-helix protein, CopG family [Thermoanaerobaculia bacterium]|nr:ribbon-helix-helix protein, CopG family [Thermoanaerobaculia bacterium]